MSVYTADGFATAGHRLVFLTNFEILQKFPDTDSVILPDFSSAAVRALFTVMYDTSHRYKYICKLISTFSLEPFHEGLKSTTQIHRQRPIESASKTQCMLYF